MSHRPRRPRQAPADADAASPLDRSWFDRHPGATEYYRPIHRAEHPPLLAFIGGFDAMPPGGYFVGQVRVTQLAPGVRVRSYADVRLWVPGRLAHQHREAS